LEEKYFINVDEHRKLAFTTLQYLVLRCFDAKLTDVEIKTFVNQGYYSFTEYALQNWWKHIGSSASPLVNENSGLFDKLNTLVEVFLDQHWIGSGITPKHDNTFARQLEPFKGRRSFDQLMRIAHTERLVFNADQEQDKYASLDLDCFLGRARRIIEQIATDKAETDLTGNLHMYYGPRVFKCTRKGCLFFHEGFLNATLRENHVKKHDRPFLCQHLGCHYADIGCRSLKELKAHTTRFHSVPEMSNSEFPTPDPSKIDPFDAISKANLAALEDFLACESENQRKSRANTAKPKMTLLKHAAAKQQEEAVAILLRNGAESDETGVGSSVTPLHLACEKGSDRILTMLIEHGANPDHTNSRGLRPIHVASSAGHTTCVQILVSKGAAIDATDPSGQQSLYLTLSERHFTTASALLELDADSSVPAVVELLTKNEFKTFVDPIFDQYGLRSTIGPALLRKAITQDLEELAHSLVDRGVDPNIGCEGFYPLAHVVRKDMVELTRLLLEKGANPNIPMVWNDKPLINAIENGNFTIARLLLEHGANTQLGDWQKVFARLSISSRDDLMALLSIYGVRVPNFTFSFLDLSPYRGLFSDAEFRKLFLAVGESVEIRFEEGKHLIHEASMLGYVETVTSMLSSTLDLNAQCSKNKTALHYGVERGHHTIVELLTEHHVDTEVRDSKGRTALWFAVEKNDLQMVQTLLHHGADAKATNGPAEQSLVHFAVLKNNFDAVRTMLKDFSVPLLLDYKSWSPLHLAVTMGNMEMIRFLLSAASENDLEGNDAIPEEKSLSILKVKDLMQRSLLHLAAQHGQDAALELILECGVGIEEPDINGCTALHLATIGGHELVVGTLLKLGADVNAQIFGGLTALHIAARHYQLDVATILLDNDADPNIGNDGGWMPLHLAIRKGWGPMISLLKDRGADVNAVTDDGLTALQMASNSGLSEASLLS
jgi:ankyrin repeat protein